MNGDQTLINSPLMEERETVPARFKVSATGMTSIDLVPEDGGASINFDHANWVDLELQ